MGGLITCSNCGKQISIIGKVCPYCHADKTKDVNIFSVSFLIAIVFLIWLIFF